MYLFLIITEEITTNLVVNTRQTLLHSFRRSGADAHLVGSPAQGLPRLTPRYELGSLLKLGVFKLT